MEFSYEVEAGGAVASVWNKKLLWHRWVPWVARALTVVAHERVVGLDLIGALQQRRQLPRLRRRWGRH